VAAARAGGDAQRLADALATQADALVKQGRGREATAALDECALLHAGLGQAEREAQLLRMAAALCRFSGDLEGARRRAEAALQRVPPTHPAALAAWKELGETEMAAGRGAQAVAAWTGALQLAEAKEPPAARAALLERRAAAHVHGGASTAAAQDLARAQELLQGSGDAGAARRVRIEQATALQAAGRLQESAAMAQELVVEARASGDAAVLADTCLLLCAQALQRGDAAAARDAALQAREAALQAVAAPSYLAAARALADAQDALGQRVEAYRALATAWATLGDLLGSETARAWVEPLLAALAHKWGAAAFKEVREAHDSERRRALRAGG
jgi:hypothetical protein